MRQSLIPKITFWTVALFLGIVFCVWGETTHSEETAMLDKQTIIKQLHDHLTMLTRTIGERSVRRPENLEKSAAYIQAQFENDGLAVYRQAYRYKDLQVSNVRLREIMNRLFQFTA